MSEVTNLPVAPGVTTAELEERRVKAFEEQAAAMERQAAAMERMSAVSVQVGTPMISIPKAERFERVLRACLAGRVAASSLNTEGFLSMARELCDGIDREFPSAPTPAP